MIESLSRTLQYTPLLGIAEEIAILQTKITTG